MKSAYILRLALKNLKGYKMRTLLTIGGVAVSVGFISFLISFGYGLQKISTDQIANIEDLQMLDITVGKSKIVSLDDTMVQQISSFSEVERVFPQVSVASDLLYGSSKIDGVVYGKNSDLLNLERPKISSGKTHGDNQSSALINITALRKLGISTNEAIGKEIKTKMVLRSDLINGSKEAKILERSFTISGVIEEGNTAYIYVPLDVIVEGGANKYTGAKIKVKNKEMVDTMKLQLEHLGFKVTSIKETVDQVNQFFGIFRVVLIGFGTVAIFVACLGMFNTLTITLMEKTREVGIMKVLGMTRKEIWRIFIAEALAIGITGGVIGVSFSYISGNLINASIVALAKNTNNTPVTIFVFPISFIVVILFLSIAISFLTGFYPSRRATRISALNALRYE